MKHVFVLCALLSVEAQAQLNNGLVGYWKLNGDMLDASGNGLNATTNLPVTVTTNRSGGDGCAVFGTDFDVNTPVTPDFVHNPAGAFSFSIWMRRSANFHGFGMRGAIWPWVPQDWEFGINNTDGISFGNSAQPHLLQADLALVLPDNAWHHYVGIYHDHDWFLYYDGQLLLQDTLTIEDVGTGTGNITANVVNGDLDDYRYYNRALSAMEVDSLFHEQPDCATTGIAEPLGMEVALYPNPTSGQFHVQVNDPGIQQGKVTVFDVRGQVVIEQRLNGNRTTIDLGQAVAGIYQVRLTCPQGMRTVRLLRA